MSTVRAALAAVVATLLAASLAVLAGSAAPPAATAVAAPVRTPSLPASQLSAPSTTAASVTRSVTSTTRSTTTTAPSSSETGTEQECERIAARSSMSNAELGPHLRSLGCEEAADGLLVGAGDTETSEVESDEVDPCGPGLCGDAGEGLPDELYYGYEVN